MRTLLVLFAAAAVAACSSDSKSGAPASKSPPAKGGGGGAVAGVSPDVLAKICAADHVDETSTVYRAENASGELHRIVVSPTRTIADMGNLVFDTSGALLGEQTGGEFPWDDEAMMAKENARVAALMDGAEIKGDGVAACPPR